MRLSRLYSKRPYSKDPVVERTLRHSVRDGVAYSVMSGAGETYFSAFALYLKATTPQIGVLASLPTLLASFAQLLSAWLGRRTGSRKGIVLAGATIQGLSWLPLALLPLAFPAYAVPILIACVILYHAGSNLSAPQWSSLMGDLVPSRRRGRYFAMRTRLASVTSVIALVIAGTVLHAFDKHGSTLAGYLAIFAVAALARVISIYHVSKMWEPPGQKVAALEIPIGRGWWKRIRDSIFVRFSVFFALMQFAVAISSPFFTVYLLRDLKFSYLEFTVSTATAVLVQFFALRRWGRISDVFGNRLVLVVTGSLIPLLPALWLISQNFWYLLGAQVVSGLLWAGFSLGASNYLYDLVPPAKRATYVAVHSVWVSIGVFLGALLGGYLGSIMPHEINLWGHGVTWLSPLYGVFFISTLARLAVAMVFLPQLREVRNVRPLSVGELVARATRYPAITARLWDILGLLRLIRRGRAAASK